MGEQSVAVLHPPGALRAFYRDAEGREVLAKILRFGTSAALPERKICLPPALERERRTKGAEHWTARALASGFKAQALLAQAEREGNGRYPPLPCARSKDDKTRPGLPSTRRWNANPVVRTR